MGPMLMGPGLWDQAYGTGLWDQCLWDLMGPGLMRPWLKCRQAQTRRPDSFRAATAMNAAAPDGPVLASIYKLEAPGVDGCYVGWTLRTVAEKIKQYQTLKKCWQQGKANWTAAYQFLHDPKVTILENRKFKTKKEMRKRAMHWQRTLPTVNTRKHLTTKVERKRRQAENNSKRYEMVQQCPTCGCQLPRPRLLKHMRDEHPAA